MRNHIGLASLLLAGAALIPAQPASEPAGLLQRVRRSVAANLSELPNYTCHQIIERSVKRPSSRKAQPIDTVHLEVAYVGGRELFAWPGEGKFEEKPIDEMVGGTAAIGNGFFAAHARAIFVTDGPSFIFRGETERDGRKCYRYDYRIPREKSHFVFRDGKNQAIAGYGGSFWVDARTLDLVRLEVRADQFPSGVGAKAATDILEYGRVRIGDRDFLLPRSAEMQIVDLKGSESLNIVRLSACRQYVGESVLKFGDDSAAPASAPPAPVAVVQLPQGLEIDAALASVIEENAAVGDPVTATVLRDAKKDGAVLVPKGATLSGRVTRVEKHRTRGFEYFVVGVAFSSFQSARSRGEFVANVESAGTPVSNLYYAPLTHGPPRSLSIWSSVRPEFSGLRPGEGIIYVRDRLHLPNGLPVGILVLPPGGRL